MRARDRPDVRRQVSVGGGSQPQWGRDGVEVVYMAQDRRLVSVDIQVTGETLTTQSPRPLFRTRTKTLEVQGTARTYAIDKYGRRFLVANATEDDKYASLAS